MATDQDPQTWFHTLATHYVEAQLYFHLNQVGVFPYLRNGGAAAAEIAEKLSLDSRVLDVLLDYAASVGEVIQRADDGRYGMTDFGEAVLDRYSKVNGNRITYNLFDVRIGAWGPVWTNLGGMLDRTRVYGRDLHRAGEYAMDGLFKLAAPLGPAVERIADRFDAATVVEIGPTSGLLAQLAELRPDRTYIGIDRKDESLRDAAALAEERGIRQIRWQHGDLFEPEGWLGELPADGPVLFFSCHFHEFLASGEDRVTATLRRLTAAPSTAAVVALEQPRPGSGRRDDFTVPEWLYAHSNVLIHHLIRNARILTHEEWRKLLLDGGCTAVNLEETAGFGFTAYVGETGG